MPLSDIVNVSISSESARVERTGFGTPIILAPDCPGGFTERVRTYSSLSSLGDDFATTTATYKMAAKLFAQSPKLPRVKVGRLANVPTQRWAVTPTSAANTVYTLKFNGVESSITSDGSTSVAEIVGQIVTKLNTDFGTVLTASDQTTYVRVVMDTAGLAGGLEVPANMLSRLSIKQDHDNPGLSDDLAAIALEDNDWYCMLFGFPSKLCVVGSSVGLADYAEANEKLLVIQTQESDVITVASGSDSTSVADALRDGAYARTALIYSSDPLNFVDCAWAGKCLPFDPGSETWAYKTLASTTVSTLTDAQRTNALAKFVNIYTTVAGVNVTEQGKVSANEYVDKIRFVDWLATNMQADVFAALASAKKIPFTDQGIALIQGIVQARLDAGVAIGGLASSPAPLVTVPLAAEVSDADKADRTLPDVKFDAVLAGAVQIVQITGTLSL